MVELCREFGRLLIFFFFNPKVLFPQPKRKEQLSFRRGEEKDSRTIELGQNLAGS